MDVSPDRRQLAITSYRSGNGEIYVMPVDGGEMQQLTDHMALDNDGTWSPDGSEIAFYSNRAGDRDIWILPASGGPARQLTEGRGQDYGPEWSPDGEMIAFERGAVPNAGVYVVPARGGPVRLVASDPNYLNEWPVWSPDGKWIAYDQQPGSDRPREFLLFRVPAMGGTPERLTQGTGTRPQWSPKGDQIFFGRDGGLWSLALDDGQERPVTDLHGRPGRIMLAGNFSTDGESLYFIWGEARSDIWLMDVIRDE